MLDFITRQQAENHFHFYFLLSYRLEDQTKKLHKDMKKSTEADLGVLLPGVPLISTCSRTYLMLLGRFFRAKNMFGCPDMRERENSP